MTNPVLVLAQRMIQNNRGNITNAPWAQAAINAIMTGDNAAGAKIADNLCQSYGISRQEAVQQAIQGLNLPH